MEDEAGMVSPLEESEDGIERVFLAGENYA